MAKYKFTDKKHSKNGIIATIIGIIALGLLIFGIVYAVVNDGNTSDVSGLCGILSFILGITGLIFGIRGFKEEDRFYMFAWIGTIVSCLAWIDVLGMAMLGM